MKFKIMTLFLALAITTGVLVSCGEDASTTTSDTSYAGPGSEWSATLKADGTFTITYAATLGGTVSMTVNGTYTTLASGFLKLTVTSATGTDAPTAGSQAYALNVPGMALLVKPIGNANSEIIPMVATGTCPTTDITANWVQVKPRTSMNANDAAQDWFGTFAYNATTGAPTLPSRYALEGFTSVGAGTVPNTATCSGGILDITGAAKLYLTPSGAIIVTQYSSGDANGSIIGMPATQITQANLDGTYAGLVFMGSGNSNAGENFPVQLVVSGSGTASTAKKFTDIDNNTVSGTDSATLAFHTANKINNGTTSNGFVTGTITAGGTTRNLSCMALENANSSGKNVLFCVGQDPGNATKTFSVLAREI